MSSVYVHNVMLFNSSKLEALKQIFQPILAGSLTYWPLSLLQLTSDFTGGRQNHTAIIILASTIHFRAVNR